MCSSWATTLKPALLLVVGLALASCAGPPVGAASPAATGDPSSASPSEWSGITRHVPDEYPTIQAAVDAAGAGDLILIDRGVYHEAVTVGTPGLTLRGVDRNEVVIDGEFQRPNGVVVAFADGVVLENMMARNHTINGFYWTGVRGFRGSYLTAVNNGDYGIYAFDSGDGLFEHSYASGSPDAAFYVGQCDPCDTVITDVVGEWSGLGYSGTNASTNMYIVNSVFRLNGAGVAPNTLDSELLPPAHHVVVAGNLIHDNGFGPFPHKNAQWATQGNGIILPGVEDSIVTHNRVHNHPRIGIQVVANVDQNVYLSIGNRVSENVVSGSGLADIALTGPSGSDNCFEANAFDTSLPGALQTKQPCQRLRFPALLELGSFMNLFGRVIEANLERDADVFYGDMPHPPAQEQMPGGAEAAVRPAVGVFAGARPDLDQFATPAMPDDLEVTRRREFSIMGVSFASFVGGLLGVYAYILPLALYAAWVVIAIWDLIRREDMSNGAVVGWIFGILVVPFLGVIAYYIFGRSTIPVVYRWVLLAGGMGVYLLFLVLGLVVGGIV